MHGKGMGGMGKRMKGVKAGHRYRYAIKWSAACSL